MMKCIKILLALSTIWLADVVGDSSSNDDGNTILSSPPSAFPVTQYTFHTNLDHFRYKLNPNRQFATLPLRYFVNDDHYLAENSGPVLFYAGNEADIMQFVNNSGFLFETAEEFQALVVFAEHRYYGTSFPNETDIVDEADYMSFLTVEQAMEDYNALTLHIRTKWNMPSDTAFVAMGGSYGANLALWLRMKNPNLWAGAIASSATPLKHILRETNHFTLIETQAYGNVSSRCPDLVRAGWKDLYHFAGPNATHQEKASVANALGLCKPQPAEKPRPGMLHDWISGALETMVQYGYPYPTSFYNPVPAFPFRVACHRMIEAGTGLGALRAAADVYYNYTGQAGSCYGKDFIEHHTIQHLHRKGQLDRLPVESKIFHGTSERDTVRSRRNGAGVLKVVGVDVRDVENVPLRNLRQDEINAWGYQVCTEVYQPMPTDGITDFEVPYTPNKTAYFDHCWKRYGVAPRANWEEHHFMGFDIGSVSNVFLSNGQLDPWRAAGIQTLPPGASPTSIIIRTIEDGAHHLDLRSSHPLDPASVIEVRKEETEAMVRWIKEWKQLHPPTSASSL